MAVYTPINFEELAKHLQNYDIGQLLDFKGIVDGIDNSNFVITTTQNNSQKKFILTIFEARIDKSSLSYFVDFKEHLSAQNINCPQPIKNKNSQNIVDFKNKKSVLVSFLEGATLQANQRGFYPDITENLCLQLGEVLAKMHLASANFKQFRKNDLGLDGFKNLFDKFEFLLDDYDNSLRVLILNSLEVFKNAWSHDLPASSCHLDLFPDNVFFDKNNHLSGVIDFYFSANDLLIYDFAIVVNAWCFDETEFNQQKFLALLDGYQSQRKFSKQELDFLNIALGVAAMRFLLSRLHDMFFTPKDSLVKIKDPSEYKQKLMFFLNNKIY